MTAKLITTLSLMLVASALAWGHCDTLAGPVVQDAKKAVESGDVTPVLKWVPEADEREIRVAFDKTLAVRKQSAEARDLADMYFYETLVRIHRAGEGEPYTGIKPAATPVDPGVEAAEHAIEGGSIDALAVKLSEELDKTLRRKYEHVAEMRRAADQDVQKGRAYVAAYVDYIHFVEKLHALLSGTEEGHGHMSPAHQH